MLPAALLTQLFFVVFSYSFLYTPMSMAFFVMGKSWINMLIFMSLAVIEIGLDCALIPRYGMWGAMVPVSIVLVLAVVLFHLVMRRVRPRRDDAVRFHTAMHARGGSDVPSVRSSVRAGALPPPWRS